MEVLRFFISNIERQHFRGKQVKTGKSTIDTNISSYYFPPTFRLKFSMNRPIRRQRIRFRGVRLYYRK